MSISSSLLQMRLPYVFAIVFFFLFIFASNRTASAKTIVVAQDGSGDYTEIQSGVNALASGDTLYVRSGNYHEVVKISVSNVTVSGYPGERPQIDGWNDPSDGGYLLPTGSPYWCGDPAKGGYCMNWGALVTINGNGITFQNFEVMKSRGRGIVSYGDNINIKNNWVHNTGASGIKVYGDYHLVEGNKVWLAADYAPYPRPSTPSWMGGIDFRESVSVTVRGNEVFHVWGEGIMPMYSKDVIIEDNIVHDNFAINIYCAGCDNAIIQRNLVYSTNDGTFLRRCHPTPGIILADEGTGPAGFIERNQTIINNVIVGHRHNIAWWQQGGTRGGLKNAVIANNTMINATVNNVGNTYPCASREAFNLKIDDEAGHDNVLIANNIIVQDKPGTIAQVPNDSAFTYRNNIWSKTPESDVTNRSSGDIIGNPGLVDANHAILKGGYVNPDWYKLTITSPAINSALPMSYTFKGIKYNLTDDFFGASRGSGLDRGAHEYGGYVPPTTPTPTPTFPPGSPTPGACQFCSDTSVCTGSTTCDNQGNCILKGRNESDCDCNANCSTGFCYQVPDDPTFQPDYCCNPGEIWDSVNGCHTPNATSTPTSAPACNSYSFQGGN